MAIRNRELSQFGSFIYVENSTQEIGITTEAFPYVGIGTTNPFAKLTVIGDTNVSGTVSATGYYLNGNALVSAAVQTWELSGSDVYRSTGNVGIGSTIPTEKLDIIGNIKASEVATASRFTSTVVTGTAPFAVSSNTLVTNLNADFLRGKTPPAGDIVGTSDNQTLTDKTINLSNNTLTGTLVQFNTALSDDDFVGISATQTLTNKTLTTPIISGIRPSAGQLQTIPSGTGTLVSTNSVGLVTTGMISDGTITNADISASAGIETGKLSAFTISGISLGSNLNDLTAGSFITYNTGTTYNGSTARTIGVAGTTINTANTLVARDTSGDFTAGTITGAAFNATTSNAYRVSGNTVIDNTRKFIPDTIQAGGTVGTAGSILSSTGSGLEWIDAPGGFSVTDDTSTDLTYYPVFVNSTTGEPTQISVSSTNLNFNPSTGTLLATVFTSLSDITHKTNIRPIENSIEITKQLEGVRFNWIDNNKPSIGLIAQNVEKVLPEIINTDNNGIKSVNYDSLIGLLVEAIKEQQVRIEELERKVNA